MRIPRRLSVQPNHTVHEIWRGHNRENNLGSDEDKARFLEFLNEDLESAKYDAGCRIEALCLMSNHSHKVPRIQKVKEYSDHMRRVHSRYGADFNRRNQRSGKVAEDRPRTCLVANDDYEMNVVFYVHANPIQAKIQDAWSYPWSTHKLYAFGKREPWMRNIHLPQWYMRLGKNMAERQRKYRQMFEYYLKRYAKREKPEDTSLFFGPDAFVDKHRERVADWWARHSPS